MLKSIVKILAGSNDRVVKQLHIEVEEIAALESEFHALNESQLQAKTLEFKSRLQHGEELDDLLPEAFATVREAASRTIGMRHYDVQLMGGIILHTGKIAEMRTGEGKTLVATLPTYLNALTGRGVHLVTVNDYLARRDAQWMGAIYDFLGLSVGVLQHNGAFLYTPHGLENSQKGESETPQQQSGMERLTSVKRQEAYQADILYGTNNEFGFDYLRDNMVVDITQRVQRERAYAIVDEVDNILVDEARTPLIISGPAQESPQEYVRFARLVPMLKENQDYTIDLKHKAVALTVDGIARVEDALKVKNLYDAANYGRVQFLENALKASIIFQRDSDYVVKDGEVVIVDEFTGRLMPGRRFSEGLHQALEAKESVKIQRESITYATITLQNYFRLYEKLAGMTGTAVTEAEEFWKIYKLEVVEIPTNMPMIRDDQSDLIYMNSKGKWKAVADEIGDMHKEGRPVLVGTTDIAKSEHLSEQLRRRGIQHEVLNAKNHEREAQIVAQAGGQGAVTVATNMAGRGTDIILGGSPDLAASSEEWKLEHDKVVELGGLHIIGTERHEARRVDNQLRGRSGRQGDPGSSRFFVALDDDLIKRFGGERIQSVMSWTGIEDDTAIENSMISKSIETAQVKVEAFHFDMRKHLVEYDDVVNTHRDVTYGERNKILSGKDLTTNIESMIEKELSQTLSNYLVGAPENWDTDTLVKELAGILPLPSELSDPITVGSMAIEEIEEGLLGHAKFMYEEREQKLGSDVKNVVDRQIMLRVIDSHWVQHLTSMENLRTGIGLHAYGQRDPLVAYKKEGHDQFQELLGRIQHDIAHAIHNVQVNLGSRPNQTGQQNGGPDGNPSITAKKGSQIKTGGESVMAKMIGNHNREPVAAGGRKIGRNELCPCDSGKKYKRCHGANI